MRMNSISSLFVVLILCYFCCATALAEDGKRLISLNETYAVWMSTHEVEQLVVDRVNFIDITDYRDVPVHTTPLDADPLPNQPVHKAYVNELIPSLSSKNLQDTLQNLSAYFTRYYTSSTGAESAKWIASKFKDYAGDNDHITVELFTHSWAQPSVITTIRGYGPNKDQFVVIGAHEDSVGSSSTGRSPGADDDGSGTVCVLEIFKALAAFGHYPDRTLKFITYAAEEVGLLGSQAIANAFSKNGSEVHAVLQLDMTGYGDMNTPIGMVTDNTNADLNAFVRILIDTYSLLEWVDTKCGYGCSDHASWTRAGYRSSFPFETDFNIYNPYIHTANDVIGNLNMQRLVEFSKIGLGFMVELGGVAIRP